MLYVDNFCVSTLKAIKYAVSPTNVSLQTSRATTRFK